MYGDHCHVIIAQYVDFVMWKLHRNVTFVNFIICLGLRSLNALQMFNLFGFHAFGTQQRGFLSRWSILCFDPLGVPLSHQASEQEVVC